MVVDSSVWIEIFRSGPLSKECERAILKGSVRIPTVVLYEIYKKIKSSVSEEVALEAMGTLSPYEVLELSRDVALLAADISLEHKIAMADSIVLAHANYLSEPLITLDNDFSKIANVIVIRGAK